MSVGCRVGWGMSWLCRSIISLGVFRRVFLLHLTNNTGNTIAISIEHQYTKYDDMLCCDLGSLNMSVGVEILLLDYYNYMI